MGKLRRKEDDADKYLRKHDPYFTNTSKNKRKHEEYPYDTPEQERRRRNMEIPISNLNNKQKMEFKEYAGAYDEDGNFDL